MRSTRRRYDLGLIIPTKPEFDYAARSVVFEPVLDDNGGFWYEFELPGERLGITRVLFDVGLTAATATASQLLALFSPQVLAIVGIGGGLGPQLRLGDVVVGSFIQEYLKDAMVTADADGRSSFKPAGAGWPLAERMLKFANHFRDFNKSLYDSWVRIARIRGVAEDLPFVTTPGARRQAEYFVQPIASGDLLVDDQAFKDWLLSHDRKLAVIEMEAAGAARAVKEYDKDVTLLVLRGISDFADGRKTTLDAILTGEMAGAWRCYAARNAIELLLAFLASPLFPWRTHAPTWTEPPRGDAPDNAAGRSKDRSRWAWDLFVRGLPILETGAIGAELWRIDRSIHEHESRVARDQPGPEHLPHAVPIAHDAHTDSTHDAADQPY
jgi:nucleoside phosphorylase